MRKPKTYMEKCKRECDELIDRYIIVNQSFENLMILRDFQTEHNDLINLSVSFYNSVISTTTQSLFIEINKMFDKSKNAVGIYSLLLRMKGEIRQLKNNVAIETNIFEKLTDNYAKSIKYDNIEALIDDSLKQIENSKDVINNVINLRDIYYAHFDRNKMNNIDELFERYKVSLLDIESLLLLNCNLCNALNNYFNNTTTMPLVHGYNDFENTVYYLKKGIELSNN